MVGLTGDKTVACCLALLARKWANAALVTGK
jgi:hypothetical protein